MKAEIKIVHTMQKVTKDRVPYTIVYALVTIDQKEFMRKFYIFGEHADVEDLDE